jgi:hypothetical protein
MRGGFAPTPDDERRPRPRSAVVRLALCDWHGFVPHGKVVFPGAFEGSSFGEREPGDVVIVESAAAGATPRLARHRVGALTWTQHEPTIADATDVDRLCRTILEAGPLALQLLRVRPKLTAGVPNEAVAEGRALHGELGDVGGAGTGRRSRARYRWLHGPVSGVPRAGRAVRPQCLDECRIPGYVQGIKP